MATQSLPQPERPRARHRTKNSPHLAAARLDSIRRAFPSDAAIADVLGMSRSQLGRWRAGQTPDPENAHRLAALDVVISLLSGYLEPEVIGDWLRGTNPLLGDRTPLFLLQQGRLAEVVAAIEAEQSGGFA